MRVGIEPTARGRIFRLAGVTRVILVGLALTLACVAAPAQDADPRQTPPRQPLLEGKRIFETKGCSHCHVIRAPGDAAHPGPDLARVGSWRDIMQFAGTLWNHRPAMTRVMQARGIDRPVLSAEEMGKLAGYLFYVRFFGEPGNAARGREVFTQRSCARCHQVGGQGGTIGPRLDELKEFASSFFLAQALWNHGPGMAGKMADLKIERPRLEETDIADIVALLRGDAKQDGTPELEYAQAGNPQVGKSLFRSKGCIQCHSIGGAGGSVGPDLGNRRPMPHVGAVAAAMWNHGPTMWAKMKEVGVAFPQLSDREIADLLAYLYFAQYMADNGNATRGGEVWQEKACSTCHAVAGEGATTAADLARSSALQSSLTWTAAMWNHAPTLDDKVREAQATWPLFDDDEMRDLVEYLRSRRSGK